MITTTLMLYSKYKYHHHQQHFHHFCQELIVPLTIILREVVDKM